MVVAAAVAAAVAVAVAVAALAVEAAAVAVSAMLQEVELYQTLKQPHDTHQKPRSEHCR